MKIRFILPLLAAFNSLQVFADNTALVPVPRDFPTNWMSRHEAYVTEAKQGGIDLLFLGDSITDGWRWGNGGSKIWAQLYAPRHAANTRTTAGRAIIAGISNLVRQFQVRLPQTKILLLGVFPRGKKN